MPALEWQCDARRPLLSLLVLAPEPHKSLSLSAMALVDTGATTSGISRRIAQSLGLRVIGRRTLSSAHGEQLVDRYVFRIGLPDPGGQLPFVFEPEEGFELRDGMSFEVILGMDILCQCDFLLGRNGKYRLTYGVDV